MALPAARYPDRPLVEEIAPDRPTIAAQRFIAPKLALVRHGFLRNPVVDTITLGNSAGRNALITPERTIRRIHALLLAFTASATVGARNLVFGLRDDRIAGAAAGSGPEPIFNAGATLAPTAGQTAQAAIAPWATGAAPGGNVSIFRELDAPIWLPDGWALFVQDLANIDVNDTFTIAGMVEHFTFPKGKLNRGELPLGFEFGLDASPPIVED